jgi:GntR family transcriptional regulator
MQQVRHAIETGAMRPGEQMPSIRPLAEELVINPNTVAKAYRELEHEGLIELRQGAGAFVSNAAPTQEDAERLKAAQVLVAQGIARLRARGLADEEIRRLVEAELAVTERGNRDE